MFAEDEILPPRGKSRKDASDTNTKHQNSNVFVDRSSRFKTCLSKSTSNCEPFLTAPNLSRCSLTLFGMFFTLALLTLPVSIVRSHFT
ncbi:hypothetical protein L596_003341 [Steinernema carpocapsae]|uniref:Uncharacterized protein n=1 Tax=Steinernema carpocapsae TaxID=34508 RepID=A0A4U8UTU5_STECR|nr:hypothetical protein L596_003341 [Steinernema carpocapsae]